MTEDVQEQMEKAPAQNNDAERNFANLRKALEEEKRSKQALEERLARIEAERKQKTVAVEEDDDDYDEPYINKSKLKRELSSMYQKAKEDAKKEAVYEFQRTMQEQRQQDWIRNNPDFYDVMQHAQKFAEQDPELAETILAMPEGFDRQKLVYRNIKAMGLHKPKEEKSSIQTKIDGNRKPLYYSPSGSSAAPYSAAGDFSSTGQKSAYDKMQELKKSLRLG